jgi:hypothetical protein
LTAEHRTALNDTALNDTALNDTALNDTALNDTGQKSEGIIIMGISNLVRGIVATTTVGTLAGAVITGVALTGAGSAQAAPKAPAATSSGGYQFVELGSHADRTFNQLLGINNKGAIAGYFGSGNAGHPNKGYEIFPPYAQNDFQSENFPGSRQTQITGLNDTGYEVGFFSMQNGATPADDNNFGFWRYNGHYHEVNFPTHNNSKPPVNQLLGINNTGTAVGFFNDRAGASHGYAYNVNTKKFKVVTVPGATSLTAAAINNKGAVAGFFTTGGGATDGFVKLHSGKVYKVAVPGASATQLFGLNDHNWAVGTYTVGSGANATTFGFIDIIGGRLITKISDPNGVGATVLNGINNEGDLVGFYTDSAGNTDGLLAFPPF